jgi:hypothetical protein
MMMAVCLISYEDEEVDLYADFRDSVRVGLVVAEITQAMVPHECMQKYYKGVRRILMECPVVTSSKAGLQAPLAVERNTQRTDAGVSDLVRMKMEYVTLFGDNKLKTKANNM